MLIDGIDICSDTVEYARAERNYTRIFLLNKKKLLSGLNLGIVCERLDLIRINRSIAVNSVCLAGLQGNVLNITSGKAFPISRRRQSEVLKLVNPKSE